jgi:hypothetical protein
MIAVMAAVVAIGTSLGFAWDTHNRYGYCHTYKAYPCRIRNFQAQFV